MDAYVERLCREIRNAEQKAKKAGAELEPTADSVYFGGGTPSLLSVVQVQKVFLALRESFDISDDAEITVECAPGQLTDATLQELLRQGMNRVSLGVQSFVDREAQAVGRLHTGAMCEAEIERLCRLGVRSIGVDLIAGLPYQTQSSWQETLGRTIGSGVTHVSVYMLEVDEESRLGREVLAGGTRYAARQLPSEDETAAMYEAACAALETSGVRQYEISNFGREGHQSRHNLKYWLREPYLGFGLDAHSMLPVDDGDVRFRNPDDLDLYMRGDRLTREMSVFQIAKTMPEPELINQEAAFEESLFLGLRLNDGVDLFPLRKKFGGVLVASVMPGVAEAHEAGFLMVEGERIWLTASGRMASNEVFSRLLVPLTA